jgi:multisubunit Na+/H+ antiporter MnhC subunit
MPTALDTELLGFVFYAGAAGLILLGTFAVIGMRHLLRILLGVTLLEAGVNLFLVATGFRPQAAAPIITGANPGTMVDPIPQALILTAIVIGVGVLALGLALAIRVHRATGTLDTRALAQWLAVSTDAASVPGSLATGQRAAPTAPTGGN